MLFSRALSQPQIYSIYKRAYDSTSGGTGVTFIHAPSKVNLKKIPDGLVGFWPMDGDGKDISGNSLSGSAVNPDWVAGIYNLAFRFDGNDALAVPNNPKINLNRVTMSAWVRPSPPCQFHHTHASLSRRSLTCCRCGLLFTM